MDNNIIDLIKTFSNKQSPPPQEIPKELKEQYPYGEFPIRYTKSGQEKIRVSSEKRFSYEDTPPPTKNSNPSLNLEVLLPLIQSMTNKKSPQNMMSILSKLLFKDNPEMEKLFKLFPMKNTVEVKNASDFPDTNVVKISSLKRID